MAKACSIINDVSSSCAPTSPPLHEIRPRLLPKPIFPFPEPLIYLCIKADHSSYTLGCTPTMMHAL